MRISPITTARKKHMHYVDAGIQKPWALCEHQSAQKNGAHKKEETTREWIHYPYVLHILIYEKGGGEGKKG